MLDMVINVELSRMMISGSIFRLYCLNSNLREGRRGRGFESWKSMGSGGKERFVGSCGCSS